MYWSNNNDIFNLKFWRNLVKIRCIYFGITGVEIMALNESLSTDLKNCLEKTFQCWQHQWGELGYCNNRITIIKNRALLDIKYYSFNWTFIMAVIAFSKQISNLTVNKSLLSNWNTLEKNWGILTFLREIWLLHSLFFFVQI